MSSPPSTQPADRLRILLVDDDYCLLHALHRDLCRAYPGWTIHGATTIAEAMRILDRSAANLDVIVCDINMPDLPGTKLLKLTRDLFPHIVRISLSGMIDASSLVGAGKYSEWRLCKPLPAQRLCEHIIEAFCRRQDARPGRGTDAGLPDQA